MNNKKLQSALVWIVEIFNKHNIPYQITGGLAAHIYGATRPVNDIDIDIPDEMVDEIVPFVKEYIVEPPHNYKDNKWKLYLMLVNYYGQLIDIGGADIKIFENERKGWRSHPADISKSRRITYHGLGLNVIDPHMLITYKRLLDGEHQKRDIREVKLKLDLDAGIKTNKGQNGKS